MCFTWIFFRATSFHDALSVIKGISKLKVNAESIGNSILIFGDDITTFSDFIFILAMIGLLILYESNVLGSKLTGAIYRSYFTWFAIIFLILFFGNFHVQSFIYFQF